MQYKTLGNTGLLVSRLCLGTMTFGGGEGLFKFIGAVDQKRADELIKVASRMALTSSIPQTFTQRVKVKRCLGNR